MKTRQLTLESLEARELKSTFFGFGNYGSMPIPMPEPGSDYGDLPTPMPEPAGHYSSLPIPILQPAVEVSFASYFCF
jgi:hypothetical protein